MPPDGPLHRVWADLAGEALALAPPGVQRAGTATPASRVGSPATTGPSAVLWTGTPTASQLVGQSGRTGLTSITAALPVVGGGSR